MEECQGWVGQDDSRHSATTIDLGFTSTSATTTGRGMHSRGVRTAYLTVRVSRVLVDGLVEHYHVCSGLLFAFHGLF